MGIILYVTAPFFSALMGAEGDLARLATNYIRGYALFSPISTAAFAIDNFLRICGKIKGSMILNVVMSLLSVVFLFVFLNVLKLGVLGAAIGVSLSMVACTIVALYPFLRGRLQLRFVKPKFSFKLIMQIVSSGSPIFLSNVASRATAILMNVMLLRLGGPGAVGTYGILMYAGDIIQPMLYGVCDSLQPAIGYNFGAGEIKRVKAIEKCCLAMGAIISAIGAVIMLLFTDAIVGLFLPSGSPEAHTQAVFALRLFSLAYFTRWFGFAIQSFLIALDKPFPATLLSVGNAFVFPVLFIFALLPLGLNGLWLNTPATSLFVSVLAGIILAVMGNKIFERKNSVTIR